MRIELDANGYVLAVYWGCYSNDCAEYTGTVPQGYTDLNEWSENALINAYYLEDGNLVLDYDKLAELETEIEQDAIDNEPLLRKDLYGYTDAIDKQYVQKTASGTVIAIDNVEKINPIVKISNIDCYSFNKVDIITQGKNMLKVDAVNETIEGIKFTKLISGGIKISGTATADIEYNLSGSETNSTPLFALKKNKDYYLNIGDLECEMKFYDGTTSQVYTGASGLINLTENKEVTQVLIKIPNGTTLDKTIYPMLEYGSSPSEYEEYKSRKLTINFNELVIDGVFPSDDLYPSDDLFPAGTIINYIYIENGSVYVSADGVRKYLVKGNVNLFDGYDTVYTLQDTNLEMTYYINELAINDLGFLQGKSTTTNQFKILEDGSIEAHNGYFSGKIEADEGYFKGDIYLGSGSKVIGGDGLLTTRMIEANIKSMQFVGGTSLLPMGFSMYEENDFSRDFLEFNFQVPNDFVITKAYIILDHTPILYSEYGTYKRTGISRNLKLYKSTSKLSSAVTLDYGYYNINSNSQFEEIYDAFGSDGFTGSTTGSSVTSMDITSYIDKGFNFLKIESEYDMPTTYEQSQEYTGACKATLYINGYTQFGSTESAISLANEEIEEMEGDK